MHFISGADEDKGSEKIGGGCMKVIDLTHEIKTNMQVFPGDPEVEIKEALTHKTDYCTAAVSTGLRLLFS